MYSERSLEKFWVTFYPKKFKLTYIHVHKKNKSISRLTGQEENIDRGRTRNVKFTGEMIPKFKAMYILLHTAETKIYEIETRSQLYEYDSAKIYG
jgi:hypothetical protein